MQNSIPCLQQEVNRTEEELRTILHEINVVYQGKLRIDVEKSFAIGDRIFKERLWETRPRDVITKTYGAHTYAVWLSYARIARKWNPEQRKRHHGKPWTWFRNNNVEGPDAPREPKPPTPIAALEEVQIDAITYYLTKIGKTVYYIGPPAGKKVQA